jgi:hypothetical protein
MRPLSLNHPNRIGLFHGLGASFAWMREEVCLGGAGKRKGLMTRKRVLQDFSTFAAVASITRRHSVLPRAASGST